MQTHTTRESAVAVCRKTSYMEMLPNATIGVATGALRPPFDPELFVRFVQKSGQIGVGQNQIEENAPAFKEFGDDENYCFARQQFWAANVDVSLFSNSGFVTFMPQSNHYCPVFFTFSQPDFSSFCVPCFVIFFIMYTSC